MKVAQSEIEAVLQDMLTALPAGKSLDPTELARRIAGSDEKVWRLLMVPIRAVAVRMAVDGKATIERKGRVVDPSDFKGVYRVGRPASI